MDEDSAPSITIRIEDQHDHACEIKIKMKHTMGKVFAAFCGKYHLQRETLRFLSEEGVVILDNHKPAEVDLSEGSLVSVVSEQLGGNNSWCIVKLRDARSRFHTTYEIKINDALGVMFTTWCVTHKLPVGHHGFYSGARGIGNSDTLADLGGIRPGDSISITAVHRDIPARDPMANAHLIDSPPRLSLAVKDEISRIRVAGAMMSPGQRIILAGRLLIDQVEKANPPCCGED